MDTMWIIYVIIGFITGIGLTIFAGYLWNYYLIKELKETNRWLHEIARGQSTPVWREKN